MAVLICIIYSNVWRIYKYCDVFTLTYIQVPGVDVSGAMPDSRGEVKGGQRIQTVSGPHNAPIRGESCDSLCFEPYIGCLQSVHDCAHFFAFIFFPSTWCLIDRPIWCAVDAPEGGVSGTIPDVGVKAPEMLSVGASSAELPSVGEVVGGSVPDVKVEVLAPSVDVGGKGPDVRVSAPDEKVSPPDMKASVDEPSVKVDASVPSVEGHKVGVEDMAEAVSGKVDGGDVDVKAELPDKPSGDVKEPKKGLLGRFGLGKGKSKGKASRHCRFHMTWLF